MRPESPSRAPARRAPWLLLGLAAALAALWFALARVGGQGAADPAGILADAGASAGAPDEHAAPPAGREDPPGGGASRAPDPESARSDVGAAQAERWSGGVVTGRVLGGPGASEPIPGIGVRAFAPRSRFVIPERRVRTDPDGRFELRDLVAAHWEIEVSLPALDLRGAASVELDEEELPEAVVDVLLPYERHVDVRLVGPRGYPVTAETLSIDPVLLPLLGVAVVRGCREPGSVVGPADMPLNRVVDKSPKGERHTFDVVIQGAGAECLQAVFGDRAITGRVLAREAVRVDLLLDPETVARVLGACAVHVVEAAGGQPVATGSVRFQLGAARVTRQLGPDGAAVLGAAPIGPVRVVVEAPGFVTRTLEVEVPTPVPVRVEMAPARRIAGQVAVEDGRAPGAARPSLWFVRDPGAKLGKPTAQFGFLKSSTEFSFQGLEPGLYVVAAVPESIELLSAADVRAGRGSAAVVVDLTAGDATGLRLVVPTWLMEK